MLLKITTDLSILSTSTNNLHKAEVPHSLYPGFLFGFFFKKLHCLKQNTNTIFFGHQKKKTNHQHYITLPPHTQLLVFYQSPCSQLFLKKVLYMLSEAVLMLSHVSLLLLWKSFLPKPMCKCRSRCWVQRLKVCMSQTVLRSIPLQAHCCWGTAGKKNRSL